MTLRPGRDCPLDYRLPSAAFSGETQLSCQSLYVVGGLYGNLQALDALEQLLLQEPGAQAVFNGDAHWFDRDQQLFLEIEERLIQHLPLRGNVETELGRSGDNGAGCGCAYPDSVAEHTVDWSNDIHRTLRTTLMGLPGLREKMASRPAYALVNVNGHRIAITHGDEQSLAGWQCSREALQNASRRRQLATWMTEQRVSVLATSHTCTPAALKMAEGVVINNGAAGMPNFAGTHYGLVSRIANSQHPLAIYRTQLNDLFVEAIPLVYDQTSFLLNFSRQWPSESPAAYSYWNRLIEGPSGTPHSALLHGFHLCQSNPLQDACLP